MYGSLEVFRLADGLARHAAERQAVAAQNVANADTPGYRARDLPAFAELVAKTGQPMPLRRSRGGHFASAGAAATMSASPRPVEVPGGGSPNGNTVSLEAEMVRGVEIRQQHDRALAVYRSALDILRTSLGRGR